MIRSEFGRTELKGTMAMLTADLVVIVSALKTQLLKTNNEEAVVQVIMEAVEMGLKDDGTEEAISDKELKELIESLKILMN